MVLLAGVYYPGGYNFLFDQIFIISDTNIKRSFQALIWVERMAASLANRLTYLAFGLDSASPAPDTVSQTSKIVTDRNSRFWEFGK